MDETSILEVNDLHVQFHMEQATVRAVDGVTFSLKRKKTLGIVGESGCGKSITAMAIMRLIQSPPGKITQGSISLRLRNGEICDITRLNAKGPAMRSIRGAEIAMIFQEPMTSLNPIYTVGDQIAESVMLHQRLSKRAALEVALNMLRKVHLSAPETRLKQYPHQLSGGMRQRVMIAMALSCRPQLLLADEPTTALDATIQGQILRLVIARSSERGMTVLFITHDLGVAAQIADFAGVMYAGRLVEHAPAAAFFAAPRHPYSRGLIRAAPGRHCLGLRRMPAIEGTVPTLRDMPEGCPFHPRCPEAFARCREEPPRMIADGDHQTACWAANPQ